MAFDFYYCVSLDIVHPSADPKSISERIKGFRITHETRVGSERRTKDGRLMVPHRKAVQTHWGAYLHEEERLYSGDQSLSEFLFAKLTDLQQHRDLFIELGKEGQVVLNIGWFSETNHSAACLDAHVIGQCGDLGLGIELNFYGPEQGET